VIPLDASVAFVANMEDVLEVYHIRGRTIRSVRSCASTKPSS
jgi:hypothetical protein